MEELQEATKEFLIESHENLDQLDTDLVGLEQAAAPGEALGRIFRALHTLKGSCSFLGFAHLEAIAHAGENLLGKLREGKLALNATITNALLQMVDVIRAMLAHVENEGNDGLVAQERLIKLLNQMGESGGFESTSVATGRPADPGPSLAEPSYQLRETAGDVATDSAGSMPAGPARANGASSLAAPEPTLITDASAVYDSSVRISVDLLDKLMTIAGEIVLARNQILQYSQQRGDPSFQNTCRQLNLITTELQEHVMKTRLQPIGNVWNRIPRVVRDAAQACGKKIRLETEGSETELDKTLLEAIRDPLTHVVRNAIDHGIESPDRRRSLGKPEEGCVRLRAYHEGGQVNVEIRDDGGGINPDRVKHKAIEQGLVNAEQAARMGTQTILGLIFLPGFSTAAAVTTTSGRGVGMDVVKTNVEKIGGSVDVHSTVGQGTTVRIRIPLTLAIIKVLIVTSAGDRYAIPQVSLLELIRLEGEHVKRGVELIHDAPVYRLRGDLLPLVYLHRQLQPDATLGSGIGGSEGPSDRDSINIVVLQCDGRQFGLVVDAVHDTEEIVVKPLQKQLKGISAFSGATVMGDGKVALILDVLGLAQRARVLTGARERAVSGPEIANAELAGSRQTLLLCATKDGGRLAIPLASVDRLEEFPRSAVERAGPRDVVQYRDQILPLIYLSRALRRQRGANGRSGKARCPVGTPSATVQVVVVTGKRQRVGLVVDRILDVTEETLVTRSESRRPGVSFTAVIQGRVTEIVDVAAVLASVDSDVLDASPMPMAEV